ncbi:MAG: chloramphenicol resistance protein, partial [Cellulophaga sp.]|nr:chloramphenicol resistance protein [Cellulophaga sp.]
MKYLYLCAVASLLFSCSTKKKEVAKNELILEKTIQPEKSKPNILFIAVDDLKPELNFYGATHIISPNLDQLASQSMAFERSYC